MTSNIPEKYLAASYFVFFNSKRQNVSQYHWEKTTVLFAMVTVTEAVQREDGNT